MQEIITAVIERMKDEKDSKERALYHMLVYLKEKGMLPVVDDAYTFHKAFRAWDVTDNASLDMVAWHLLYISRRFWELLDEVIAELTPAAPANGTGRGEDESKGA